MEEYPKGKMFYDAGGLGGGVRNEMNKMSFATTGVLFGGKVDKPEYTYIIYGKASTNQEYFHNWGSQAGWNLRLRANNTKSLFEGEDIDPYKCLFINPEIPRLKDVVLAEMAQAEWQDDTGKLRIEKQPHEPGQQKPPSPDCFDAVRAAFGRDAGNLRKLTRHVIM